MTAEVMPSKCSRCGVSAGVWVAVCIVCSVNFCTATMALSAAYRGISVSYLNPPAAMASVACERDRGGGGMGKDGNGWGVGWGAGEQESDHHSRGTV